LTPPVLHIQDLSVEFQTPTGTVAAVNEFSLTLQPGETVALVGESGSGKSVSCLAVMGLLPPSGLISSGSILFNGEDLLSFDSNRRRRVRGKDIAMIFQEPMTSLNPVFRVGNQIAEATQVASGAGKVDSMKRAKELLDLVRISDAESRLKNYPHEMSGGMRQRIMIAMALAGKPSVLIADEPTTALDVTVQAQILELLADIQKEMDLAMLFVTHDLGVVAGIADRVCVMYAGQKVEMGGVNEVYERPLMPYTAGLLSSVPRLMRTGRSDRLTTIPGSSPEPGTHRTGCAFAPRCTYVQDICREGPIPLLTQQSREARCIRLDDLSLA
jgi:oligopeptide/dipeptide ABC transporter ATP-binding protein